MCFSLITASWVKTSGFKLDVFTVDFWAAFYFLRGQMEVQDDSLTSSSLPWAPKAIPQFSARTPHRPFVNRALQGSERHNHQCESGRKYLVLCRVGYWTRYFWGHRPYYMYLRYRCGRSLEDGKQTVKLSLRTAPRVFLSACFSVIWRRELKRCLVPRCWCSDVFWQGLWREDSDAARPLSNMNVNCFVTWL